MNLTVVIPFYEGHRRIGRLLQSIPPDLPVIVVDDQSVDPFICTLPNVRVYRPDHKLYFTGAVNYGIAQCKTDVLILNQDTWLEGDQWLDLLAAQRQRFALVGERIKGNHPAFPYGYVHGTFQFMRRDAIEAAGPMDAKNYPIWGASALWQWQITRKGFRSNPLAEIPGFHHERPHDQAYGDSIKRLLKLEPERRDQFIRTPPAVSVVIPAYNYGRWLPDAVASLIGGSTSLGDHPGQTFQSFEIIIVDDGSTDNTPSVGRALADDWKGIRYIRQNNGGSSAAMNTGIKAAHGKYICRLDADDMREPWSLAELYQAIEANPHSLIYDDPTLVAEGKRQKVMRLPAYDFDKLLYKNMVHAGIMFPKQGWADAGGYPTEGAIRYGRDDWAFNVALGLKGYCGIKLERGGYLYRRHGANRTEHNTDHDWQMRFAAQMVELFPQAYKGQRPTMCCGKGSNPMQSKQNANRQPSAIVMADVAGLVRLEYTGGNVGSVQWGGLGATPTGRVYVFGKNGRDRVKFVDQRDVAWFLDQRSKAGQPIFVKANDLQPAEPAAGNDQPVDLYAQSGGITFQDLVDTGLIKDTTEARQSLVAVLENIARPTDQAKRKMQELGIKRTQAARTLAELQEQMQQELGNLPVSEQIHIAETLFGDAGSRAALAVLKLPGAVDKDADNNGIADNQEQPAQDAQTAQEQAEAEAGRNEGGATSEAQQRPPSAAERPTSDQGEPQPERNPASAPVVDQADPVDVIDPDGKAKFLPAAHPAKRGRKPNGAKNA